MSKTIGVILKDNSKHGLTHDYFAGILEGFRQECNLLGYSIAFINMDMPKDDPEYETVLEQVKNNGILRLLTQIQKILSVNQMQVQFMYQTIF